MSKSSRFDDFFEKHPDTEEYVANTEFVMKQLDNALDDHTHNGKDSPLIDQSVTLDFAAHGGTIYVRTPAVSSGQGELPDTSGLGDIYTKAAIDNKLAGKSDAEHTHVVSNITDFPTAIKNPEPLTINGQAYDGSSSINFDLSSSSFVENELDDIKNKLNNKSDNNHVHDGTIDDIFIKFSSGSFPLSICIYDLYDKKLNSSAFDEFTVAYNNKTQDLENKISAYHTKDEVENLLDEKADKTDTYTKSEVDATMADVMKTNADAIMTAQLTAGGAQAVETSQVRNIYAGTAAMAENASLATGAIYLQYA
jgi:hypothetical protein